MKYKINLKNLLTGETVTDSPNYPFFNHESYKIQVSVSDKNYVLFYRSAARWDFGDGTVVEGISATHYYSKPGHYTIRCTLYSFDREIIENTVSSLEVIVKEVIPTELSILDTNSWAVDRAVSKNNKLGLLQLTTGSNVISEPKISAYQRNAQGQQNYFDICNESFYHLKPYWTFLQEEMVYYSNGEYAKTILKPTEIYTPKYISLYGRFVADNNQIKLEAYTIGGSSVEKILQSCKLEPYRTDRTNGSRIKNFTIAHKEKISELPDGCSEIGKIGIAEIWYKNDNDGIQELFFEIKKDTLQLIDEPDSVDNYLNLLPLGISLKLTRSVSNENLILQINSAGIYDPLSIIDFSELFTHNFYKNYAIEGYLATYIKNDELNGEHSYNMLKNTDVQPPPLFEASEYDEAGCKITLKENGGYYLRYEFVPLKSDFYIRRENGSILYSSDKLVDLDTLIIPSEKKKEENIDELLSAYMQHPMYNSADNVKQFLHDIFSNKDILSYLTSKGTNFIDDNVNYKTCYVNKLLSILEMLDNEVTRYDVAAFEKVNDLRDLTRILTMNYSHLFGTVLENEYDIEANAAHLGKNIGNKVDVKDTILCNDKYEIIGFRTDSTIYQLSKPSPFIVVKDNMTFKTHLASFHGIISLEFEDFADQSEEWREKNKTFIDQVEHSYHIGDYDFTWGWSLNLPENAEKFAYKHAQVAAAYSFYIFNPAIEKKRKYNFVAEDTIPVSEENENEQISVEEWNRDFGFVHDCLMKVLTQNLK